MTTDELVTIAGKKCVRYSADHVHALEAERDRLAAIVRMIRNASERANSAERLGERVDYILGLLEYSE